MVFNDDKMYVASFENDFNNCKITHTIHVYDFKKLEKDVLNVRTMNMDITSN